MMRRLLFVGLVPVALLFGVACGGGDDSDDGDAGGSDATATATTAATEEATATATEAATEAPTEDAPSILAPIDGLTCSGDWTNNTYTTTGSFEVVFAVNDSGDAGVATVTLGGNVFGGFGGTVEMPFSLQGDDAVVDGDADFLGAAKMTFNADGQLVEAVFDAPPALNSAQSSATLKDFVFDDSVLTMGVDIDFGGGAGTAESVVESSCS